MENWSRIFANNKLRLLAAAYLGIVPELVLENTNIPGYDDLYRNFNYNRLRAELTVKHESYPDFIATLIADNETFYVKKSANLTNNTSIYRGYFEYRGANHFWVAGKQRIPLGVGKFWNPIDVFNPVNIQAIEQDERPGTESIHYEYALSRLADVAATVARGKGVIRIKGYLDFADLALVGEFDDEKNLDIIGWEAEGELADTGIELRSEGGGFHDSRTGRRHTEFIVGAEYGFANSLTITGEYHYLDLPRNNELAISTGFQPTMLWNCYLTTVINSDDGSGFVLPVLEYSLSDEMTISSGAFVYFGKDNSAYGYNTDRFYIRWFIHF